MLPELELRQTIEMIEDESNRDDAADFLLAMIEEHDITQDQADTIMTAARVIDPTESNYAAIIRDTIRDNSEVNV